MQEAYKLEDLLVLTTEGGQAFATAAARFPLSKEKRAAFLALQAENKRNVLNVLESQIKNSRSDLLALAKNESAVRQELFQATASDEEEIFSLVKEIFDLAREYVDKTPQELQAILGMENIEQKRASRLRDLIQRFFRLS